MYVACDNETELVCNLFLTQLLLLIVSDSGSSVSYNWSFPVADTDRTTSWIHTHLQCWMWLRQSKIWCSYLIC